MSNSEIERARVGNNLELNPQIRGVMAQSQIESIRRELVSIQDFVNAGGQSMLDRTTKKARDLSSLRIPLGEGYLSVDHEREADIQLERILLTWHTDSEFIERGEVEAINVVFFNGADKRLRGAFSHRHHPVNQALKG